VIQYKLGGIVSFEPPVSLLLGKDEYLYYLYNNEDADSIIFVHGIHEKVYREMYSVLVYQGENDSHYKLIRNTSVSYIIHEEIVGLYNMQLYLLDRRGHIEHEKYIYKLFDVITGEINNISIPHDHQCSRIGTVRHAVPFLFKDKLMIGCSVDSRPGLHGMVYTLFNIT
jgi:hypothetical protein